MGTWGRMPEYALVSGSIPSKDISSKPRLYHLSQAYILRLIHATELTSLSDPETESKPDPHVGLLLTRAIVGFGVSMATSGCAHPRHLGVYIPIPSTVGTPQLQL